ncbi:MULTISPECIES: hypothetical protein [unclassified Streptomyces]
MTEGYDQALTTAPVTDLCPASYIQVSNHIRDRHWSMGIAVPVYSGQK